jgi:DNA-directed RNA polymerase subunit K/omega
MSKKSIPYLTKYELAAIFAERAVEIANGDPITIKNPDSTDPIEIAKLEYYAGKSPKKIVRKWPDGSVEIWSLNELINNF